MGGGEGSRLKRFFQFFAKPARFIWHLALALFGRPCPYRVIDWCEPKAAGDTPHALHGYCTVCGATHEAELWKYRRAA